MKNIIKHPTFKLILFVLAYVLAGYFTYHAFFNVVPIIPNEGRGLLTQLPLILVHLIPIFAVSMVYLSAETYNVSVKWKIRFIAAISVTVTSAISLILQILFICLNKFTLGIQNAIYPFDTVIFGSIFLLAGIATLVYCLLNKELKSVPNTSSYHVNTRAKVATIAMICFSNFFLGDFYSVVYHFEYLGKNSLGMIPFVLTLLMPTLVLVLQLIYKVNKNNPLTNLLIGGGVFGVLIILDVVALCINPLILSESLTPFFPLGYLFKTPFGLFLLIGVFLIVYVFSLVKTILKYKNNK